MTVFSMGIHPSDEELSRLADQAELDRARSRAGRHVASCEACSASIASMRALGDAARAMPVTLPPGMLDRITAARRHDTAAASAAVPVAPVADNEAPLGVAHSRTHRITRVAIPALAAAAVLVAVLLAPMWRRHVLAAASPGEATIYPHYPKPGATIGIRFVPGPRWVGPDTIWASGPIDLRLAPNDSRRISYVNVGAPMARDHDGAYRGRLTLPDDALSGSLMIWTAHASWYGVRPVGKVLVLTAGAAPDRPSLDAMESAAARDRGFMARNGLTAAFARWAPDHPMRWLVSNDETQHGAFDWLRFFTSTEARYKRLAAQFDSRKDVRVGELAGMAALAYRIEEPEAAAAWTERLVREHPADPAALDFRVREIHELELRGTPKDSIVPMLPSLDTLYARNGGRITDIYPLRTVIANNADSATARRWMLREARAGAFLPPFFTRGRELFDDAELRDSLEAFARDVLADRFLTSPAIPESWYSSISPPRAYASLASIELARGHYRLAVALTDSARVSECIWPGQDTRAFALLASGDTSGATPYLAAYGTPGAMVTPDSARRVLGSHFTATRWQQAVDSVEAVRRGCRDGAR